MAWLINSARRIFPAGSAATLACLLLLLVMAAGCTGVLDPITPYEPSQISNMTAESSDTQSQRVLWGYYKMSINEDHTEMEVEPLRGAQLHLNVVSTIEAIHPAPIILGNMEINPDDGTVTVEVSLLHPLEGYPEYTGFDVRGIMMLPTVYNFPNHGLSTPGMFPGESALINADGYTRRWNPTEFSDGIKPFAYHDGKLIPSGMGAMCTSLINPYKAFWWDENRRYFEPGTTLTRHYIVSFPPGPQTFAYAIDASWQEHRVDVSYATSFEEDDPDDTRWEAKKMDGFPTDFWDCGWFTGSVNVRDEACSAYMGEGEASVLFSRKLTMPEDPSYVEMRMKHTLDFPDFPDEFPDSTAYDGAAVFLTANFELNPTFEVYSEAHPYDFLDDPELGFDWWMQEYENKQWDVFNLSPALTQLKELGHEEFRAIFIFINGYDNYGIDSAGWTIDELEIWNRNAPPSKIPDSFPMNANSMEPYEILLSEVQGGMECSLGRYAGGDVNMKVEVSDWQFGAEVTPFSKIKVEAPELFDGTVSPWTGSGNQSTYTYEIIVPNDKKVTPGEVPVLFSLITGDETDEYWLPDDPLAAYMMFKLEVEEISPPFCLTNNAIHNEYGGAYQILGSNVANHLDCAFMPIISGGAGGLLFDGGISGDTQHIQVASIYHDGGTTTGNDLTTFTGSDAGNSTILATNEYNGHILVVTDDDPDNLHIYNAVGLELMDPFDLGNGEDGLNEPVCMATNPSNGDIWLVGNRGADGIYLERWAYITDGSTFTYTKDPSSQVNLGDILGIDPKPLGIAINGDYQYLYLFHAKFFGSMEVFEIGSAPTVLNEEYSGSNIFPDTITPSTVSGLRRLIGGDIVVDHVDGEEDATCRMLLFANVESGGSWLVKMDTWGHKLGSTQIANEYACMTISNRPSQLSRPVILFPMNEGIAYTLYLTPDEW